MRIVCHRNPDKHDHLNLLVFKLGLWSSIFIFEKNLHVPVKDLENLQLVNLVQPCPLCQGPTSVTSLLHLRPGNSHTGVIKKEAS